MKYDLLIKGGTLVDPAQGIHEHKDVAFSNGRVATVAANVATADARARLCFRCR